MYHKTSATGVTSKVSIVHKYLNLLCSVTVTQNHKIKISYHSKP